MAARDRSSTAHLAMQIINAVVMHSIFLQLFGAVSTMYVINKFLFKCNTIYKVMNFIKVALNPQDGCMSPWKFYLKQWIE